MASPPGAHRTASPSRGALPPAPFPAAAHFASRAAGPFLRQLQEPLHGDVDDDDEDDDEEEAEMADGAACRSQQRCASAPGIGRAEMNGGNGMRQNREEQQWQHGHIYSCGNEQYRHASPREDEPSTIPREMRVEDGYGVIGRREGGPASSYWDLLRAHLSDPLTWVSLNCGCSLGKLFIVLNFCLIKACGKCGQPITEDSIRPNLALRLAVQAFKREEESAKSLKRRRERLEQEKCGNDEPNPTEISRGKGVQFPFAVFDRVIIKVRGEDLRQCRECEVAIPFSGKVHGWWPVLCYGLKQYPECKLVVRYQSSLSHSGCRFRVPLSLPLFLTRRCKL
uniref:Uncharacterized protein n=1 Tax=Leersia perrieri TaxID=77586 RepID=A0A0D9W0N5_9ORYZ